MPLIIGGHEHDELVEWHGTAPRRVKQKKEKASGFVDAVNAAHHNRTSSIGQHYATYENVTDFQAAFGPQARRVAGFLPQRLGETQSTSATATATTSTGSAGSTVIVKTGCNADRAAVIDLHISLEPMDQVLRNL